MTKIINVIDDSLINAAVITQTVIDIASTDAMGVFIDTRIRCKTNTSRAWWPEKSAITRQVGHVLCIYSEWRLLHRPLSIQLFTQTIAAHLQYKK